MAENNALVMDVVAFRLRAADAALNMIHTPIPEGLLHLPLRRHLLAAARADVKLAQQVLTLHKRHLDRIQHEALVDQSKVLEERVHNTNIHAQPQES